MSASFMIDRSRELKGEVWEVEEEVSRGGTSLGWTIQHHGQWRNHGYSSDSRNRVATQSDRSNKVDD